jgi:uncharacterized repeat protein (TIGR03806 family)
VRQFPGSYLGKYFFADYMDNWIRVLDPADPKAVTIFATGLTAPVDLKVGPDGSLYCLNRKEWVKDDKFHSNTGSLVRISYAVHGAKSAPHITAQPVGVTVIAGQSATFHLTAEGAAPLRYQWHRNGRPIPDATGPELRVPAVRAADDGAVFRCTVSNPFGSTKSARTPIIVTAPRSPAHPMRVAPGLDYEFFEGRWNALPDFTSLKSVKAGTVKGPDLAPRTRDRDIGFAFRGFVSVPTDGAYTFQLISSGPTRLVVAGTEVAVVGPAPGKREVSGTVGLRAGKHALLLMFAHRAGRPILEVRYGGPSIPLQALPAEQLFRTDLAALAAPTIEPPGGSFTGPLFVRLTTTTTGAMIRYTADGSEPSSRSPLYTEPLRVDHSLTIRAKVFGKDAGEASAATAVSFTITGKSPYGLSHRELATTLFAPSDPTELPPRLSQTGVFRSLADLAPNPGIIPFDVNTPLWSDGAAKRRWIALPGDARIDFAETGEWKFPPGTVFIKHFGLESGRRLETRLLVVGRGGTSYGVTYKWRPDNSDADLLAESLTEDMTVETPAGPRKRQWAYPSRNDCLLCHTTAAGFVLGVKTRQLNRSFAYPGGATDNQLRTWNHLGMFTRPIGEGAIPRYARLVPVSDTQAPLEHRVRSYLDANCAHCHRPGGARAAFDARFDTPLADQHLVNGPLTAADLGVHGARLVTPGDPARSMLYLRTARRSDVFNMPPLATNEVDAEATAALAEWIKSLPAPGQGEGVQGTPP